MVVDVPPTAGYSWRMTAAVQAVLDQARRLTAEERAELVERLNDLEDLVADQPVTTREEIDQQLARSIAEARRGELIDADEVLADLE
ncbi:hypothetical protein BH11MYX2_BH11MYX2_17590 [soil metagenome]